MAIIIWELVTTLVLVYATMLWIAARKLRSFEAPRRMTTFGLLSLLILFMGGFSAIGGEWFQMWRSMEWTGLGDAFQNSVLALILIHLPSADWDAPANDQAFEKSSR